jgi:hypothetical protein
VSNTHSHIHASPGPGVGEGVDQLARYTKIAKFDGAVFRDEHIRGFDVTVNDAFRVQVIKSIEDLPIIRLELKKRIK